MDHDVPQGRRYRGPCRGDVDATGHGRAPPRPPNLLVRKQSSREELRLAIVTWMERAHHRKRRQRALGRLTPIEFETIQQVAPSA